MRWLARLVDVLHERAMLGDDWLTGDPAPFTGYRTDPAGGIIDA